MCGWDHAYHIPHTTYHHIPRPVVPWRQKVTDYRHDEVERFFVGEYGEHGEYDRRYILASSTAGWCPISQIHRTIPGAAVRSGTGLVISCSSGSCSGGTGSAGSASTG
jgi:hypothetical protein